jgi:hypothetical protein
MATISATISAVNPRAKLSVVQVLSIFQAKNPSLVHSSAAKLAIRYGVSEKTIRDIWTGRTWSRETYHKGAARFPQCNRLGRPKGRLDSKPRKRKSDRPKFTSMIPLAVVNRADRGICLMQHQIHAEATDLFSKELDERVGFGPSLGCNSDYGAKLPSRKTASSLDQQLQEWGRAFWIEHESADPFHDDWDALQAQAGVAAQHRASAAPELGMLTCSPPAARRSGS